ncbi:DUF294 nucleotidyltransferase-like domain-containing protein [Vibrio sp. SS-MA-C1-2]|uniref:putative nucleotidyltransferase substrate binding domain-containing protein n=1 Tax=Vibrio sp. SS-MA-C1-2 TaxID=2908646 RepID=UPI001F249DFE|nr:putative nucleotidyltransferase substrate binding domain-containing protein [Vibrio sp. SS-MA-C1-2]UJF17750.1 DUF294 nucleotidyltransferase-like domain-containing protein [Vibrio sp. SS-MA-C1-2]
MSTTLMPNILHFIEQIDPFDKLPKSIVKEIAMSIEVTFLSVGEQITFSSDKNDQCLYIIRTGAVEQRKLDGTLKARLASEDLFGFTFLDAQTPANKEYTITAIEESLIYLIPAAPLYQILNNDPTYLSYFASNALVRLKSAMNIVWSSEEKGLFFKTVTEVANYHIATVTSDTSIQEVAREMRLRSKVSCAFVMENKQFVGLITDKDMTKRVIAEGIDIQQSIATVMTPNPFCVNDDDLVFKATALMMEHNIQNIPVVHHGQPVALITAANLIQKNRVQAVYLVDKINKADSIDQLVDLTAERQAIFEALVEGKVPTKVIGQVMAMIMDCYNRRLIALAEDKLGSPPCEYLWMVAGSHARNEVNMTSDQDSAIVFSDSATEQDKIYFTHLAMDVCKGMDLCGYPLCTGRFMAASTKWCQSLSTWKAYYRKWSLNPEYDLILNISVFLEIRAIYGDNQLFDQLNDYLHQKIDNNQHFISALVRNSLVIKPPLSIFKNLVLIKDGDNANTLNIKSSAISLLVDLIRIYAVTHSCQLTSTEDRLSYLHQQQIINEATFNDLNGAYQFFTQLRYNHQAEALKRGSPLNNNIDPSEFGSFERKHLREAFKIIADFQDLMKLKYNL